MDILELYPTNIPVHTLINVAEAVDFLNATGIGTHNFEYIRVEFTTVNDHNEKKSDIVCPSEIAIFSNDDSEFITIQRVNTYINSGYVDYNTCTKFGLMVLEQLLTYFSSRKSDVKRINIILNPSKNSSRYGITRFNSKEEIEIEIYCGSHISLKHCIATMLHEVAHSMLLPDIQHCNLWSTTYACLAAIYQTFNIPGCHYQHIVVSEIGQNVST